MNVRTIVEDYLREHGYDGLCARDCGCGLDKFMPCEGEFDYHIMDCQPAMRSRCTSKDCEYCACDFCDGKVGEGRYRFRPAGEVERESDSENGGG